MGLFIKDSYKYSTSLVSTVEFVKTFSSANSKFLNTLNENELKKLLNNINTPNNFF